MHPTHYGARADSALDAVRDLAIHGLEPLLSRVGVPRMIAAEILRRDLSDEEYLGVLTKCARALLALLTNQADRHIAYLIDMAGIACDRLSLALEIGPLNPVAVTELTARAKSALTQAAIRELSHRTRG